MHNSSEMALDLKIYILTIIKKGWYFIAE